MSRRLSIALGLSLLALFALACHDGAGPAGDPDAAAAWVSDLRAAHERADAAEQWGDLEAARLALETLAGTPAPAGVAPTHARAARQDLYFRLATLAAMRSEHADARDAATAGLALGQEDDVLTANLLIARAEAEEALGEREGASRDFLAALRINEALLDAVLAEEAAR